MLIVRLRREAVRENKNWRLCLQYEVDATPDVAQERPPPDVVLPDRQITPQIGLALQAKYSAFVLTQIGPLPSRTMTTESSGTALTMRPPSSAPSAGNHKL
jgi:hypothetical protein